MSGASTTKRFIDGVIFGFLHRFLDGAIRLITMPLLLGWVGPEVMGFRAALLELIGYFQKINPGSSQTMQAMIEKDIRPDTSSEQLQKTKDLLSLGVWIQYFLGLVSLLAVALLAFNMDFVSNELPAGDKAGSIFFVLSMGLILTVTLGGSHHSAILSGQQFHKELELAFILRKITQATFTIALVWLGYRLWGMGIAAVLSTAAYFLLRRYYANNTGLIIKRSSVKYSKADLTLMLGTSGWMLLATIGDALGLQSYRLLSAVLPGMGLNDANKVAILFVLPSLITQLSSFAGELVRPALKQKYHAGNFGDDIWSTARLYLQVTAMLASITFIFGVLHNKTFISLWVGVEYYIDDSANISLSAMLALCVWTASLKNMLYVRHDMRLRGLCAFFEGVLIVALSVYMGINWGISAMFLGGALAISLISTPVYAWFLGKRFKFNFGVASLILKVTWYPCLISIVFYYFRNYLVFETTSWWEFLAYVLLTGIVCLAAAAVWLWRPLRPFVLKALRRI